MSARCARIGRHYYFQLIHGFLFASLVHSSFAFSLFSLVLLMFFSPFVVHAELIDRVVASVNNEVITLRELNQAVSFNAGLSASAQNEQKLRAETLEGLINRRLLLQEAFRIRFVEVSDQDISAEIKKLKERLGSDSDYTRFLSLLDSTEEQLGRMLSERLLVQRFVEKKIGLFVRVSSEEAENYFDDNPDAFKGKRFLEVQKAITAAISERKLEQQTAQYLDELKTRAEIRINP